MSPAESTDKMREEVSQLDIIIRRKKLLLERLNELIKDKEATIRRVAKEQMEENGTWVADMNRLKKQKRLEVLRSKVVSRKRLCNTHQARDAEYRLEIDDLRRGKIVYSTAFARLGKELERSKRRQSKIIFELDRYESAYKVARDKALALQANFDKTRVEIQDEIRKLDEEDLKRKQELEEKRDAKRETEDLKTSLILPFDIEDELDPFLYGLPRGSKKEKRAAAKRATKDETKMRNAGTSSACDETKKATVESTSDAERLKIIQERTSVTSIDTLLEDFADFEQKRESKMMEANQLIMQLNALRSEEQTFVREDRAQSAGKMSLWKKHSEIVQQLVSDTKRINNAQKRLRNEMDRHVKLVKSLAPVVEKIKSAVMQQDLMRRIEESLAMSKNAFGGSGNNKLNVTSKSKFAALEKVRMNLGAAYQQILLLVQYYVANVFDGTVTSTPKYREEVLKKTGPQYSRGSTRACMDRTKIVVPFEVEKLPRGGKSSSSGTKRSGTAPSQDLRPFSGRELRESTAETFSTIEQKFALVVTGQRPSSSHISAVAMEDVSSSSSKRNGGRSLLAGEKPACV